MLDRDRRDVGESSPTLTDQLHRTLLSPQGVVDSLLAPLVFLVVFKLAGLGPATIAAGALALAVVALRTLTGKDTAAAWGGAAGVLIGCLIARATGTGEGFFWPKVATNALWALALMVSIAVRRPLVGVAWALLHRQPPSWGFRRQVRGTFAALTALWAAGYLLRVGVYLKLLAGDQDATGALAVAQMAMGLPLTGALIAVTWLVAARRLGAHAKPAAAP